MLRGEWRIVVGLVALTLCVGCGKTKQPWEKVAPVRGAVKYKGKPLAGALITLIPVDTAVPSAVRPTATSKDDGTFQLGTYSGADGAPAGEYKALVLHYPIVGKKESPSAGPNDLPVKYAKAETTDLKVTIAGGQAEIDPLELQ